MNRWKFAAALVYMIALSAMPLLADDTATLKSADGQYQFVVPAGWESADFHVANVQIGATNKHLGEYAEVVAERLEDYVDSLTQYAEGKRDVMAMSLDNPMLTAGTALKINGRDAVQFEVHGQLPGSDIRIGYLLTVMKTKTHYIQVIGWTVDSHFPANRPDLENLANGFSEITENKKAN
jgi:hypothetical protein